jgi:hypothetical protein
MTNVIAKGSDYGWYNTATTGSYSIFVDRSTFEGATSIGNDTEFTLRIGSSKLVGPVVNAGVYNCVYVYKADPTTHALTALSPSCL